MRKVLSSCLGMSLWQLCAGCSAIKPEASVEGVPQACCKRADPKLQQFEGCRVTGGSCSMRRGEKFWMRGAVACGPVDEAECEGGRCCEYQKQYDPSINQPIENWAPEGFDTPTNNVTDPSAKPQHGLPEPKQTPTEEAPSGERPEQTPASEGSASEAPAPAPAPAAAPAPAPAPGSRAARL